MSEAQDQGQATSESSQTQAEGQSQGDRTFSQDDVNKIVGQRAQEAASKAEERKAAELLGELSEYGVESFEDVKSSLEAFNTAVTELEGEEIADLKKQHKETLKAVQTDLDSHKEALQGYLDKEREGLQEHVTELLDTMSAPDQLAYITKHGDALRAEVKPQTIGRGSSPGGGSPAASQAEVTPGIGRLKVAYSKRS